MYKPIIERKANGGTQDIYRFPNGYGASVIRSPMSYGYPTLFELAVIKFPHADKNEAWNLCYDTPVTDDVIGYLTSEDVQNKLKLIKALPKKI